jgi:serine/threonine protein kinase
MSTFCKDATAFDVLQVLGTGQNGIVLLVRCNLPAHPFAQRLYALKVCFNFEYTTNSASRAFENEFRELARLPAHPNIVHFVFAFFAPYSENVRAYLPDFARQESLVVRRGDSELRVRSTQYFVLHTYSMSLSQYLQSSFGQHDILPLPLVQKILHSVGSALQFLRQHAVMHLDVKLDNILVELQDDSKGGRTLRRCVLADFGTAQSLPPSLKGAAVIDSLGRELTPHWGNDSHICPELHSALASAMMQRQECTIELDFACQTVFELAVLAFEIVLGVGPLGEYPGRYQNRGTGVVYYTDFDIAQLPHHLYPASHAPLLHRAVSCEPSDRPPLAELMLSFAQLCQ